MKATWNKQLLAESSATVLIEGNHYFPQESIKRSFFQDSETRSICGWKGEAHYYSLVVEGEINQDAAWYYPKAKDRAKEIEGMIAFWKGVTVSE